MCLGAFRRFGSAASINILPTRAPAGASHSALRQDHTASSNYWALVASCRVLRLTGTPFMSNVRQHLFSGMFSRLSLQTIILNRLSSRCSVWLLVGRLPTTMFAFRIKWHIYPLNVCVVDLLKTRLQQGDGKLLQSRYVIPTYLPTTA